MHRFYLPPENCKSATLTLSERDSHHAADVLRIREGETVTVLDGVGRELQCVVRSVRRKAVDLETLSIKTSPPLPFSLTLAQAVPKGKLIEYIIQKATELGATCVQPVLSERVVLRLDDEDAAQKAEKWQQVAIEAIKQCGQTWLPRIEPPKSLTDCLAAADKPELSLIGSLQPGATHPRLRFDHFRTKRHRNPQSACVWIGPEGDFTPEEMTAILGSGVLPVTFGPLVLRSETAALCALSIAAYELRLTDF
jgi:16S rRNA (uracil1498-N3)-methyltransferase